MMSGEAGKVEKVARVTKGRMKRFLIERINGKFVSEIELTAVDGENALRQAEDLFAHGRAVAQYRVVHIIARTSESGPVN